ncbi:MAG: SUMF1/EgtB/PvdO family nonheme iron enzyme [Bacteroidetes bacterium]|nr:SUMF1/EgtB/PvdO family nonheme iron enzyme [Bacteroidota bacterium]
MIKNTMKLRLLVRNLLGVTSLAVMLSGCGLKSSKGELTGVPGRKPWYHNQPYGTVYVPTGTFHMGQSEQDILGSLTQRPKQVSIPAFFMDDTEITNNEYRQFVFWVRDSIAKKTIGEDQLITDENGNERLDWSKKIDYADAEVQSTLQPLMYSEQDKVGINNSFDTRKLIYDYKWLDLQEAAKLQYKLNPVARKQFIHQNKDMIYPDTLAFIRDFTYSYNEPMAQTYFWHPGYDDYPVVGVSWKQATAFCWWRTNFLNAYYVEQGDPEVAPFRLPTEAEWEYAARGGRRNCPYPWGGPYTRNSRGCFLCNFKPLRGNYMEDGGYYPVKGTAYFPNDYGLYCMAGNVSEWTTSAYDESIYSLEHDLNPDYYYNAKDEEPASLKRKVIRGGSWKDIGYFCQVSTRSFEYADTAKSYVGFRCAMSYMGRSIKDK